MSHSLSVVFRLAVIVILLSTANAGDVSASGQAIRFGQHPGYGRIVFEWGVNVAYTQIRSDGQLILQFDQPMSQSVAEAASGLREYLAGVEEAPDRKTITLLLKKGVVGIAWQAGHTTVAVDLSIQAGGAADLTTRVGSHDGVDRIVLDWQHPGRFTWTKSESTLTIRFDRDVSIDAQILQRNLPHSVKGVRIGAISGQSWLELQLTEAATVNVSDYGDQAHVVIDVSAPRPMPPAEIPSVETQSMPALAAIEATEKGMISAPTPSTFEVALNTVGWTEQLRAAWSGLNVIIEKLVILLGRIEAVLFSALQPGNGATDLPARYSFKTAVTGGSTFADEALVPGAVFDGGARRRESELGGRELTISDTLGSLSGLRPTSTRSVALPGGQDAEARERTPVRADILGSVTGGQAAPGGEVPGSSPNGASETAKQDGEGEDASADPELLALNRVLVEAGGLLLPTWGLEISPEVVYEYSGSYGLLVIDGAGGQQAMAQQVRSNSLQLATTLRVGLPWDSQAEVRVPYDFNWRESSLMGQESDQSNGNGIGDVELGVSHQFLREGRWWPDLLGEVRWKTDTGKSTFEVGKNGMATGTGFNGITGAVTAVKSYDPLVFFGKLGYTANLSDKKDGLNIDPGDSIQASFGTVLSTGPGTSLKFGISESVTDDFKVNGDKIAGTDQVIGMLTFGVAAALPDQLLLDISAGVGITQEAPDFALRAALPYRF